VHLSTFDDQVLPQPPPDTFMVMMNSMTSSLSHRPIPSRSEVEAERVSLSMDDQKVNTIGARWRSLSSAGRCFADLA
jgi:hypothetical protein